MGLLYHEHSVLHQVVGQIADKMISQEKDGDIFFKVVGTVIIIEFCILFRHYRWIIIICFLYRILIIIVIVIVIVVIVISGVNSNNIIIGVRIRIRICICIWICYHGTPVVVVNFFLFFCDYNIILQRHTGIGVGICLTSRVVIILVVVVLLLLLLLLLLVFVLVKVEAVVMAEKIVIVVL